MKNGVPEEKDNFGGRIPHEQGLVGYVYSLDSERRSSNDSGTYEIEERSILRGNCGTAMGRRKG